MKICFIFLSLLLLACTKRETILAPEPANTVTDIDGNRYPTVTIGNQTWMAENLRVTRYRNGEFIQPKIKDNSINVTDWMALTTGAWCNYENKADYDRVYGKLYNFQAVDDPRGLAPKGWHIPDTADWRKLVTTLGGPSVAGGKLKSTILWDSPNTGASNSSGFSGFPAGRRYLDGTFNNLTTTEYFWTSSEGGSNDVYGRELNSINAEIDLGLYPKTMGFSVVCIKDN